MSELKIKSKKFKSDSKYLNLILKYIPCLLKGLILTVIGILVLSFAYYKMTGHPAFLYYLNYLFLGFGTFITGNSTYHKLGGRGIVAGILGSLPLLLIDIIIIFLFSYRTASANILIIVPICIIFGAIGGIVGSNAKKRY